MKISIGTGRIGDMSQEFIDAIDASQYGIYMVSGCGTGKSYFVREHLMKKYTVLNVNFLNSLNMQNFSDTYMDRSKYDAENWTGTQSATINVQNLEYITDEAIKKTDILVIDEIQEMWISAEYRYCSGDTLMGLMKKFRDYGVKILVMTGTPLHGTMMRRDLGLDIINVEKEYTEDKDTYEFTFVKGLNISNIGSYTSNLINQGKTVVIMSDRSRKQISKRLISEGIIYGIIESSHKSIDGTYTQYLIKKQKLEETTKVYITTSVLAGGININNTLDESEIVYICFINDIVLPHKMIQFAGRSREQKKVLHLGYSDDSDFDINFKKYEKSNVIGLTLKTSNIALELQREISGRFNSKEDWEDYIYTYCGGSEPSYKEYIVESGDLAKESPINWGAWIKNLRMNKSKDTTYQDWFKLKPTLDLTDTTIIPNPNGKGYNMWANCPVIKKGRMILKALDLGFDLEVYSEKRFNLALRVVELAEVFWHLLKINSNSDNDTLKNECNMVLNNLQAGIFDSTLDLAFSNNFSERLIENGVVSNQSTPDTRNRIALFQKYKNVIKLIFRKKAGTEMFYNQGAVWSWETPEEAFMTVAISSKSTSQKGNSNASKRVILKNILSGQEIEFNSAKDADEYARHNLGLSSRDIRKYSKEAIKDWIKK